MFNQNLHFLFTSLSYVRCRSLSCPVLFVSWILFWFCWSASLICFFMESMAERLMGFLCAVIVFPHLMDPLARPRTPGSYHLPFKLCISCHCPQSGVAEEKSGVSLILILHRSVSSALPCAPVLMIGCRIALCSDLLLFQDRVAMFGSPLWEAPHRLWRGVLRLSLEVRGLPRGSLLLGDPSPSCLVL